MDNIKFYQDKCDELTQQNLELVEEIRQLNQEKRRLIEKNRVLNKTLQMISFDHEPDKIIYKYFLGIRVGSKHIFKNKNK